MNVDANARFPFTKKYDTKTIHSICIYVYHYILVECQGKNVYSKN